MAWGWGGAAGVAQDVRFAVRQMLRRPMFALLVIAVLGLGIGLNAAMFSMVDGVLLRPLPYPDPGRLVVVWQSTPEHRGTGEWFNQYRHFTEWQRRSRSFTELSALTWGGDRAETVAWRGQRHPVTAIPVSANFFSMLGVKAEYGHTFTAEDGQGGCAVVLGYAYWRDVLGGDAELRPSGGQQPTLTLGTTACRVVGVMPKGFAFYPKQTSLWTVITPESRLVREPWDAPTGVFGRLRPGVTRAAAEQELGAIEASIANESPAAKQLPPAAPVVLDLQREFTWLAGRNLRQGLWLLTGAVALLLVIGCVNVASLLLRRAVERQREMAIRAAIGCGRARMVRQLVTEALVLSVGGAAAGVGLAAVLVKLFLLWQPVELPPGAVVAIDWQVVLLAAALSAVCALVCGVAPAWRISRVELTQSLKGSAGTRRARRTGRWLVVAEAALSMLLLSGALLLARSLAELVATPVGFRTDHLLTAGITTAEAGGLGEHESTALLERLRALPGVRGAALVSRLMPYGSDVLAVQGRAFDAQRAPRDTMSQTVSEGYFATAEIPLLAGRTFARSDTRDAQAVAVVNHRLAEQYFANGDAVGRRIKLGDPSDASAPWLTVVGVVGNVHGSSVFQEMGYTTQPEVFRPMTQAPGAVRMAMLRTGGDPASVGSALETAVKNADPNLAVSDVKTMDAVLAEQSAQPRFRTALLGGFAAMALLLAGVGIYGVLAQQVAERTREIGVRIALGAQRAVILRGVLRQGLALSALGLAVGGCGALAVGRLMAALLYRTRAADPVVLGGSAVVLLAVAVVASLAPAWRASRVEPLVAMRE